MNTVETVRIEEWEVVGPDNPYAAPECRYVRLQGKVYGHPKFTDGTIVSTSRIESAKGKLVTTFSGTVYSLGQINEEYEHWLDMENIPFDPENPIKVHKKEIKCLS